MDFNDIVHSRYATKRFSEEKVPQEKVDALLEMIRMAASSYGLQPWKVKIIADKETKEKLLPLSHNQAQITTCSHLLVFCANTDIKTQIKKYGELMKEQNIPEEKINAFTEVVSGFEARKSEEEKLVWAKRQSYIALGNAINGAKALGFDSCPMEGFQPDAYKKELNLPEHLHPVALVPIGFAADEPRKKIRYNDLFF